MIRLRNYCRKFPVAAGLVLLTVSLVFSQTTNKTKQENKIAAELMQLERDIGDANVRRDKAFFERAEADEFIFTDSAGNLTMKAEDVTSLDKPASEFKLTSYVVDNMKVMIYDKTAIVTGQTTTTLKGNNREIINKSRFTDVFVKREGRWQVVAGHSSRIREPQK